MNFKRRLIMTMTLTALAAPLLASPSSLEGRLDLLLEQQDPARPGLSIAVLEDGNMLYQRSKGMSGNKPITEHTVFPLGTLSQVVRGGEYGSTAGLTKWILRERDKLGDFSHSSGSGQYFHILYGNSSRNLYVIVLSNGGANTAPLARQVVEIVREMYEQPTPM